MLNIEVASSSGSLLCDFQSVCSVLISENRPLVIDIRLKLRVPQLILLPRWYRSFFSICTVPKNPIYVFPEMKLHGLVPTRVPVPNSYIHVSVSDLITPRKGLSGLQQNRQTDPGKK
jgi:hypothetical protein